MKYTFYTSLNIEECKEKLRANLKKPNLANANLVGKIDGNKFWVVRLNSYPHILVNRVFYGYFEEAEKGTLIKGKWKYTTFMRVFAMISLGVFIMSATVDVFKLIGKATGIISSVNYSNDLIGYIVGGIAAIGIMTWFRLLSGDQEYDTKHELKRVLQIHKEERIR